MEAAFRLAGSQCLLQSKNHQEDEHMTTTTTTFTGFPQEGIDFLRDLAQNNNREWFEANRKRYESFVRGPALAMVEALGQRVAAEFPPLSYSTKGNGGSLMRINRDVRFSADKSPYKTNIAMMFVEAGNKKMGSPGMGIQITPEYGELIAGLFGFDPARLEAYREAVLDDTAGPALEEAAAQVAAAGAYPIAGKEMKRVPRGYDEDHPRAEWLKYKGLHVFAPSISPDVVTTPQVVDVAMGHFRNMAPVWRWLMNFVEPRIGA
jgi:uncharacterized protein (TIGR02453 family)